MYKLLIVDDEEWIRERLKSTIDWNALDIEVAGEASDGEEALAVSVRISPDIVVTDIRMPCVDGLGYIKGLKEMGINAKVIIISGYSDFEYARKAIKLGAFDYILKPVEDEDLIGVVRRCIEEIDADRKKDLIYREAREKMLENLPFLKKELYMSVLNNLFYSEEEIMNELSSLNIPYDNLNRVCFIIGLDEEADQSAANRQDSTVNGAWNERLIQFVLLNLVTDFSIKLGKSEVFAYHNGEVICLVFSDTDEKVLSGRVLSISNGIRKMIRKITNRTVTIGIGRVYKSLHELALSYREAREALQYRAYFGKDRIYDIRTIDLNHKQSCYRPVELEALLNHIRMGSRKDAKEALEGIIKGICRANGDPSPIDLKLLYMDIGNSVFKTAMDVSSTFDDLSELSLKFFSQLNRLQTVEEIRQWLSEAIFAIIGILEKFKTSKKRKIIERSLEYIHQHFTESITLSSISEKFYLNESYFCKIFKEEIGVSFTRYLINQRIQKAMKLLEDPTAKMYEIAAMVGYTDVQYFSKIFKSIQGITPGQYREKIK